MKVLTSNRDLYDYMQLLSSELRARAQVSLSEAVTDARAKASSSSTEFLGESRIALRRVLREAFGTLTDQERTDMMHVLAQLDQALDSH